MSRQGGKQLTRTKSSHRGTATRILLGALFGFGFLAPYAHIPFNTYDSPGIFGFTYMSGFFFSIGFPIFLVVLAGIIRFSSTYMPDSMKKLFRIFALLTAFTGFYFLSWSLNPLIEKDYHPLFYYGSMLAISVVLSYSMKYYRTAFEILKSKKDTFLDFLVEIKNNHYKKMLKRAIRADLYNETYQEEVKKDSKNFDERIRDKAEDLYD